MQKQNRKILHLKDVAKMKRMQKKFFFLLFCFITIGSSFSFSQGPPPAATCPDPPCAPIPIDGGVSFLLIAGAAYGAKKVYKSKKHKDNLF